MYELDDIFNVSFIDSFYLFRRICFVGFFLTIRLCFPNLGEVFSSHSWHLYLFLFLQNHLSVVHLA